MTSIAPESLLVANPVERVVTMRARHRPVRQAARQALVVPRTQKP